MSQINPRPTPSQHFAKIFVCNTYQIASLFVNKFNGTCTNQNERGKLLGEQIIDQSPDLVFLQEMWGGGQRPLELALAKSKSGNYIVPSGMRSWWGWSVVDTAVQYSAKRGGLWFTHNANTMSPVVSSTTHLSYPYQYTYKFSNTKSLKGIMVTKFVPATKAGGTNPPRQLLVFNTHLDPININHAIEIQLAELASTIKTVIKQEVLASGLGAGDHSLPIAAVVVGDFNISPDNPLYQKMFSIMGCDSTGKVTGQQSGVGFRELLSEKSKAILTYDPKNPYVLWPEARGRLDHIFAIDKVVGTDTITLAKIELINEQVLKDPIVSDHYPFVVNISF